jgi:hypothetical protein
MSLPAALISGLALFGALYGVAVPVKANGITFEGARGQSPNIPGDLRFAATHREILWRADGTAAQFIVYRLTEAVPMEITRTRQHRFPLPDHQVVPGACFSVASVSEAGVQSDLAPALCFSR